MPAPLTLHYRCPICGKVLVHIQADAPVTHHAVDDHRLMDDHLEGITINGRQIWA